MKAEKLLKNAGIRMKLIPVPRSLTSDCGLAIRIAHEDVDVAYNVLKNGGNEPKEYYVKEGKEYKKVDISGDFS